MAEGKDLLAGEPTSGGGRDLLSASKAPVYEAPGALEKAKAVGYGFTTGLMGSGGELEQFLYPTEAKGEGALKGHATLFPTVEESRQMLEKVGIPRPRKEVSGYETAGEIAPAVYGGGRLIYDLGKAGVKGISKLIGGGKDLAEELKITTAGKTAEEIEKAGKKATTSEKRAGVTEKIAEREAKKGETAYGQLPGVTTTTEAGAAKNIPQAEADIGTKIRDTVQGVFDRFKATRQANAEKLKSDAFNFAKQKELAGERIENTKAYKDVLNEIDSLLSDKETGLAVSTLDAMKNPLLQIRRAIDPRYVDEATGIVMGRPISFKGMEELRRFLRDRSYGLPAEGFDAINQQKAGDLAKAVEKAMSEFSDGKINTFINQYRKDSEPLRVFQTRVGKALVDEQLLGKGVNYANVPAQSIPGKVFKSKEDFGALIDALGGNEGLAKDLAKNYYSAQLEGKTAAQARKFLSDNRSMLKETGSYDMVGSYVQKLEQAEKRGATALERGKTRTATAAEQRKIQGELKILQSDIDRADKITNPKEKIDYINKQAQKLANYLPIDQRNQFLTEVQGVVNAEQKKLAIKKWSQIALGAAGLYTTGHVVSGYIGK